MKTVFFGASSYVLPIIDVLNKKFGLEHVITTEKNGGEPVISFCKSNKIPYFSVSSKENLKSKILNLKSLDLGVVADFGIIIPKEILESFTYGILNIHPSLLPKYRGPTPVQSAFLNGDKTTGVTIIKLDEHIDHGPILTQENEPISPEDTSQSLYEILFAKGAHMLSGIIEPFSKGELKLKEQKHEEATFTNPLKREDGFVDVLNLPEYEKLENMIRAYYPW